MQLLLGEIAQILETGPVSQPNLRVAGYSIDSRTLRPGELFFAVRGQRLDGHDFVMKALEAGAAGAVVDSARLRDFPASATTKLLAVPNALVALHKLAAAVRCRWGGPLVAVTGSTGKTTTRQMIAALLGTGFHVLQSEGNLNNQFGLPLSLLRLERETDIGVFELGMSAPGEIRLLATLAAPDIGVVTNVSAVHLEFFPDVEAIACAKYELIEELRPEAWAVLNADDARVRTFGNRMAGQTLYYGISHPAHFQALGLEANGGGGYRFTVPANSFQGVIPGSVRGVKVTEDFVADGSPEIQFHLALLGRHNVLNVLASLAVCYAFGIPPSALTKAVQALRPPSMRGELVRLANGALVVNDCYNSSPDALEGMLTAVASVPARRRFAVLGGMMELGPTSEALHRQGGSRVGELGYDGLFTVGEPALAFAAGARAAGLGPESVTHFNTPEEAGSRLRNMLQQGDVILLKGSRAVHLEKVWEQLEKQVTSDKLEVRSEKSEARG